MPLNSQEMEYVAEIVNESVRQYVWRTSNSHDKEDLQSHVYVTMLERISRKRERGDAVNLEAFVRSSASNVLFKYAKKMDQERKSCPLRPMSVGEEYVAIVSGVKSEWTNCEIKMLYSHIASLPVAPA